MVYFKVPSGSVARRTGNLEIPDQSGLLKPHYAEVSCAASSTA